MKTKVTLPKSKSNLNKYFYKYRIKTPGSIAKCATKVAIYCRLPGYFLKAGFFYLLIIRKIKVFLGNLVTQTDKMERNLLIINHLSTINDAPQKVTRD